MTDLRLLRLAATGTPYPHMQKTAGAASTAGKFVNRVLVEPVAKAVAGGEGVVGKAVGASARKVVDVAQRAPMETAMLGGTAAIGGLGLVEAGRKHRPAKGAANREAAKLLYKKSSANTVCTSVQFDTDSVARLQVMRGQLEKTAGAGRALGDVTGRQFGDWLKMGIAAGIAGSAIGAGQQVMTYGIGKVTQRAQAANRGKHYNNMIKADPGLKSDKLTRTYFNVLHRASPYVASEPVIAAATVRTMLETPSIGGKLPTVTHRTMKDILDTEEARQKSEMPFFRRATKAEIPSI